MGENVVWIFLIAFFAIALTFGFFFVRGSTRSAVVTLWGIHPRADSPAAYWFWAIWYVVGTTWFGLAVLVVTLYFVLDAFT